MSKNTIDKDNIIDYKDIQFLKKFLSEKGKITPRRLSYTSIKKQKNLSQKILLRNILISYQNQRPAESMLV